MSERGGGKKNLKNVLINFLATSGDSKQVLLDDQLHKQFEDPYLNLCTKGAQFSYSLFGNVCLSQVQAHDKKTMFMVSSMPS